jgi:thioredoxin 1
MTSIVTDLTSDTFEAFIKEGNVVVDFWAPWCGPCRVLGPILDEIANELKDMVLVGKVNVDENVPIAGRFNVKSIPTLVFFKDGQSRELSVGLLGKDELLARIRAFCA